LLASVTDQQDNVAAFAAYIPYVDFVFMASTFDV